MRLCLHGSLARRWQVRILLSSPNIMTYSDFRNRAPPFVLVGSDRCQLQVIGAGETFRAVAGRPYVPFSRAFTEAHARMYGSYPPPLVTNVILACVFTGLCPDVVWPSAQHNAADPKDNPSDAANQAAAGYKLVMTPPFSDPAMVSAHLAQGHPLILSTFIFSNWPTASEVTPGYDMFRVPTDPGVNTGIPHVVEVDGENGYGRIVRDPRTSIWVNLPYSYPGNTWWAITDCVETVTANEWDAFNAQMQQFATLLEA